MENSHRCSVLSDAIEATRTIIISLRARHERQRDEIKNIYIYAVRIRLQRIADTGNSPLD